MRNMGIIAAQNVVDVLKGEVPLGVVNKEFTKNRRG